MWGLDATGGGLDQVSLVAAGNQAGGVPVRPVLSPGYSAAVYGAPSSPQPTLAAVPSSALAEGTFTVKATLRNPTPQPLRNATILLNAPSGWQVSPSGAATLGTVAAGAAASASFQVTAPASGLTPGLVGLLAKAAFGSSGHEVYVFEQSVSLASGKTVAAVTLPSLGDVAGYNPALHIFAIAVG